AAAASACIGWIWAKAPRISLVFIAFLSQTRYTNFASDCASIQKHRKHPSIKQGGPAARGLQRYNYKADSLKPQPAYFV
ncbi:MAG: hypothetical protein ACK464_06175, partial [Bacteroidota bacterium]